MDHSTTAKILDDDDDDFKLSPVPATATLPVSTLPNRQNFRPLTAEESDLEDFKSKRASPYLLRSIDPIPIRPGVHRMNSTSSVLTRTGYDAARSLPRSSVDVHMASCSSSPTTAYISPSRDRDRADEPMAYESVRTRARGATINSYMREHEEHQERVRKLSDVLDRPSAPAPPPPPPPVPTQFLKERRDRGRSPDTSAPGTRTTSPVSPPGTIQSPLLQRPTHETGSRASTAALEAERARAVPHKEASMRTTPVAAPAPPTSPYKDREREYPAQYPVHPPQYPPQQYQPRRPSTGSIRIKQTSAPATASNLTRSLWGMQDPQRA